MDECPKKSFDYNKPVKIIEVQTGPILKETDIIRFKDIYGRVN